MARAIHTRWKVKGTLQAETPIHIGGMGGDAGTDLALAVNGQGKYYIPGTSLAGALRSWMGRLQPDGSRIQSLWGFQENDQKGHASFIIVDDAELQDIANVEIREGVGIHRCTGAAADKAKYSRAILPKGVTFPLNITVDSQDEQNPQDLWQLLLALEQGDIRLGAAKTRGLGQVKLIATNIEKHDLSNAQGLFDSLLNRNIEESWKSIQKDEYKPPERLALTITWKPREPVMVKAEGDGIAVDIMPLVSRIDQKVHFVIPGSSIKGVLRAHAERIVRTVCHCSTQDGFLEQTRLPLIDELFGAAEKNSRGQPAGKIGALFVDDCYALESMQPDNWLKVETAPKANTGELKEFKKVLAAALDGCQEPFRKLQPAMHVAVDRWTGGAAEGMLYSVLEPIGVEWNPIGISLDLERLKQCKEGNFQPAIALLLLVLRDFANRKIPVGYGTNRGMGTVEVTEISMNSSPIDGLVGIETKTVVTPDLSSMGDLLHPLTDAWRNWIAYHQEAE